MQPLQFAALNFALAVVGLLHWINWHANSESHLLQWAKLEARLAHDGKQPELLAVAREHRLQHQQPLPPFYVTYALIYTVLMMLRLVSRAQFDPSAFVRDLSGGALYALLGAGALIPVFHWGVQPNSVSWLVSCLILSLVLTGPLDVFAARREQREAVGQQQQ